MIIDLGDISGARANGWPVTLWVRLYQTQGTPYVSIHIVKG